jgi:hypothetical protein
MFPIGTWPDKTTLHYKKIPVYNKILRDLTCYVKFISDSSSVTAFPKGLKVLRNLSTLLNCLEV